MKLEVQHRTTYRYSQPVAHSQHRIHMMPRAVPRQRVLAASLTFEPAPQTRRDGTDAFGNPASVIEIETPHSAFEIAARCKVEIAPLGAIDLSAGLAWDKLASALGQPGWAPAHVNGGETLLEVRQFRCPSRQTEPHVDIAAYTRTSFQPGRPILEAAMDLTRRIKTDFRFDPEATDVSTPVASVFQRRRGVCQDFAHLALSGLRALGMPARYVSGYLLTQPPPGQPKLQGADASHAWIAVWCPQAGWVDFDPTNGLLVSDEHVTIAWGRDYEDISPITGVLLGGGEHAVSVAVDVNQVPAE